MSFSTRALRPIMRSSNLFTNLRHASTKPMVARLQASSSKTTSAQQQQAQTKMMLMAAMPQLVPFYWVNEVVTAFILLPTMIYLSSKYFLPQTVRAKMARLFISKL